MISHKSKDSEKKRSRKTRGSTAKKTKTAISIHTTQDTKHTNKDSEKKRSRKTRGSTAKKMTISIHTTQATKQEAEKLRKQIIQYMDGGGYLSWSPRDKKYIILGTNSPKNGLVRCPDCGVGELMVIKSRKTGKRFIGCSNFYGGCDASSPLLQKAKLRATKQPCDICKWPEIIFRYSRNQKWTRQCSNIACPKRS